jgi:hypothetical protein
MEPSSDDSLMKRVANGQTFLLSAKDICTRLNIPRSTFDRWRKTKAGGRIVPFPPPDFHFGSSPRWETETFKKYLRDCVAVVNPVQSSEEPR